MRWPEYVAMARAAEEARLRLDLDRRPPALPRRRPARARPVGGVDAAGRRWPRATERVDARAARRVRAFHPPGMLAKMAATVDEVSGGPLRARRSARAGTRPSSARSASRSTTASRASRRPSRSSAGCWPASASRSPAASAPVEDAVLLPAPGAPAAADGRRQRPADAGGHAPARRRLEHLVRRLRQHAGGLRGAQRRASTRRPRAAGRDPGGDRAQRLRARGARPRRRASARPTAPPLEGSPERIAARLRALADAGADEAILVVEPDHRALDPAAGRQSRDT